jgi:hypothetical protein
MARVGMGRVLAAGLDRGARVSKLERRGWVRGWGKVKVKVKVRGWVRGWGVEGGR